MGNKKSTEQQTSATGDDGPKQECGKCPVHCPRISEDTDDKSREIKQTMERKMAYVYLQDDYLKSCIDDLLKGLGLKLKYISRDYLQTIDEHDKRKFDDETATIILVRHASSRLDSAIEGCLRYIADSDIERTVIVLINEFRNNMKGKHGEIIRPNVYGMSNWNDIKSIVTINYKCCNTKTKCRSCNDALKEIKKQAISPNYK